MAVTLEECDAMTQAADQSGVVLRVGHIQHFLPDKRRLAQAIDDDVIGPVRLIHDFRTTDYRPGSRSAWFLSRELAGGGAVMNIGAHCLDRIIWFAGSFASTVTARTIGRFDVAVETDASIQLHLASGASASVTVVSDAPRRRDEVTVVGERGSLVADARLGTLLRQNGVTTPLYESSKDDIPEAFRLQLADFVGAVNGEQCAVSLPHSRHVIELVLAAYASNADDGRPVALESAAVGARTALP
jgi:predicted dehydrogenase